MIGIDNVALAASARAAGYKVYAVDYFGDRDLKRVCCEVRSMIKQKKGRSCGRVATDFNPKMLLRLAKLLLKEHQIDAVLLSSGLDDYPDMLSELNDLAPIIGNHPDAVRKVRDKEVFFGELKRLNVCHPLTMVAEDISDAVKKAKDVGYPVVIKPYHGFGGVGVRKVENRLELERTFKEIICFNTKILVQKYVSGIHASLSFISLSNRKTSLLTINEQLLGLREFGQNEPFGYCGNIVPLRVSAGLKEKCKQIIDKLVEHFGLVGSNGVDIVISKDGAPSVIEVNPRFQGTLECVEKILKINVVKSHVDACIHSILPNILEKNPFFCARMILFAHCRSVVPDLTVFKEARDIPFCGVIVEESEPLCSIVITGVNRYSTLKKARKISKLIYRSLQPVG